MRLLDVGLIIGGPAPPSFPSHNEQGLRLCRQCGAVGRYKDRRCVEKWGPGPHGPGTVCDRCVIPFLLCAFFFSPDLIYLTQL